MALSNSDFIISLFIKTLQDLAYSMHQYARFSNTPWESHKTATIMIGIYLMTTRNEVVLMELMSGSLEL